MKTTLSKLTIGDKFKFPNNDSVFTLIDNKRKRYTYELTKGHADRRDRGVSMDVNVVLID